MTPDKLSRRTILFVNIAHGLDHFVLLVYPTAVIAMAPDLGFTYASLIGLSTGAFVCALAFRVAATGGSGRARAPGR